MFSDTKTMSKDNCMIYFFDSGDEEDQPNKEIWELFNWFLPFDKRRIETNSKGVLIAPEKDVYRVAEVRFGDTLTPAPFITEDMRHHFIEGIFKAFT